MEEGAREMLIEIVNDKYEGSQPQEAKFIDVFHPLGQFIIELKDEYIEIRKSIEGSPKSLNIELQSHASIRIK